MNRLSATPAWPRRPPLWSSAALCVSLLLGFLYCWAAVKLMPGNEGRLFPIYLKSAAWSLIPQFPSFGKHVQIKTHRFVMPDGSAIEIPPKVLHGNLRAVIFRGRSALDLFRGAFVFFASTLFLLL